MTEKPEIQPEIQPETRPDHGVRSDQGRVATASAPGGSAPAEGPPPAHAPTSAQAPRPASRAADLTTSKVIAGGMAAATSAVLGSHFGAFGTVGGAAVGSVVTTVGASLYQRSLERARDRVARQIPLPATLAARTSLGAARSTAAQRAVQSGAAQSGAAQPGTAQSGAAQSYGALEPSASSPAPAPAHFPLGRLIGMSLVGALVFFALGLGVVTGIEWAKGSPLYGGTSGTSVGQALQPATRRATIPPPAPAPTVEDVPTTVPTPTPEPGSKKSDKAKSDKDKSDEGGATQSVPETPSIPVTPSPLPLPGIGVPGG